MLLYIAASLALNINKLAHLPNSQNELKRHGEDSLHIWKGIILPRAESFVKLKILQIAECFTI